MAKDIPRDWSLDVIPGKPCGMLRITDGAEGCVAEVRPGLNHPHAPSALAEGHLIAAAPDLLEACRAAITYNQAIRECGNSPQTMASFCTATGDTLDDLYDKWITSVRAAIAKAEGKE